MVYAYTKLNLGDDLFIKILSERYPNTMFYLYAPKEYKQLFKDINNIKVFSKNNPIYRLINLFSRMINYDNLLIRTLLAKKSHASVHIGGSLFIQDERWKKRYEDYKHLQFNGKPFFLLGANFGPFEDEDYYLCYKELFKQYTDICFRENYSYELFSKLPNVRKADDIIFQLKTKPSKNDNRNVAISVIKPSIRKYLSNYDEIYYKKIKDITIYFIDKGYTVSLMSFCESEGDREAIQEIMKILPDDKLDMVKAHYYKYNIDGTLKVIEESDFIIASRFHSMILGWISNKPVFPIVYSNKMTNVMDDVGFQGFYTDFNNIEKLKPSDVYESMKSNLISVSKQIKNSEGHFKLLDRYLINE